MPGMSYIYLSLSLVRAWLLPASKITTVGRHRGCTRLHVLEAWWESPGTCKPAGPESGRGRGVTPFQRLESSHTWLMHVLPGHVHPPGRSEKRLSETVSNTANEGTWTTTKS